MESKVADFFHPFPLCVLAYTFINYLDNVCQSLRICYEMLKGSMDIVLKSEKLKAFELMNCFEIIILKLDEDFLEPHDHN